MLLSLSLPVAVASEESERDDPQQQEETRRSEGQGREEPVSVDPESIVEERVRVVGSADAASQTPGSVHLIGKKELAPQHYTDIQRVLRRVPGVYLQDEEGYGLRPNIGLRGTGLERSQKVTLMEDGILIAPAPYSAPSAYYFPTASRMEAIEVSKGPSAIRQGPYTTGGAVNMISNGIPEQFRGAIELAGGTDNAGQANLGLGGSSEHFGWIVETVQQQTDGFKRLDGGGNTGYDLEDYVGKLRFETGEAAGFYQSVELKLGKTEQTGDETYLGLTQDDYDETPFRRYAASSEDRIDTDHEQIQLRYFVVPSARIDLTTTVYNNDFFRNWHKLEKVGGVGITSLLENPSENPGLMDIVRGDADSAPGDLLVRNNRRTYYSRGVQTVLGLRFGGEKTGHDLEVGLRYHQDEEDRFQEEDAYQMIGGSPVLNQRGDPGTQANRISRAEAWALFVQDKIRKGGWLVTPGVRFESVDYTKMDYRNNDPDRTGFELETTRNDVQAVIPGVGVGYDVNPSVNLFGGVHRGFAPPGPGQDAQTEPEESVNYELGVRYGKNRLNLQAVGFYNDYDNLLGTDTVSGGGDGTGNQFNGGEVEVVGLELAVNWDFASGNTATYSLPFRFAYTYTRGEFRNSFDTGFADWAPSVEVGDRLPYLPENQLFAEMGWLKGKWGAFVSGSYIGRMRTVAGQGAIVPEQSIEDHLVLDAVVERFFGSNYKAFVRGRNLTDEVYVAARRPAGLRPGLPRTILVGFGIEF